MRFMFYDILAEACDSYKDNALQVARYGVLTMKWKPGP